MRALILSGGVAHSFADTSRAIADRLAELDIVATITSDAETGLTDSASMDLLVFNLFRDDIFSKSWPVDVPDPSYSPSEVARAAVLKHLKQGGGLLALHGAMISFADWYQWGSILGAHWVTGRSGHPKRSAMHVEVLADSHPIVRGIPSFQLAEDEAYGFLDLADDNTVLATSSHGGMDHPMLWIREYRGGRVAYLAPAHGMVTHEHPIYRQLLKRTLEWLVAACKD
jgi:type 1 glutamine amidotransferase